MSRLTLQEVIEHCERTVKGYEWTRTELELENIKQYWEHRQTAEWLKELQHYKGLEEQGRLIELPCKVGDTVYKLWYKPCYKGCDYPDSYECCGCYDECTLEQAIFEFVVPSVEWIMAHLKVIREHIFFLTKEEAEAKLAELKGE